MCVAVDITCFYRSPRVMCIVRECLRVCACVMFGNADGVKGRSERREKGGGRDGNRAQLSVH